MDLAHIENRRNDCNIPEEAAMTKIVLLGDDPDMMYVTRKVLEWHLTKP